MTSNRPQPFHRAPKKPSWSLKVITIWVRRDSGVLLGHLRSGGGLRRSRARFVNRFYIVPTVALSPLLLVEEGARAHVRALPLVAGGARRARWSGGAEGSDRQKQPLKRQQQQQQLDHRNHRTNTNEGGKTKSSTTLRSPKM